MNTDNRELTRNERAAIRKLVTGMCANYDSEYGCLLGLGPPRKIYLRGGRRSNGASELSPQTEVNDTEFVTTSECYMLNKCWTGAYCKYFQNAVLPLNPVLKATLTGGEIPTLDKCAACGKPFVAQGKQAYCSPACADTARRKRQREYMRKKRA